MRNLALECGYTRIIRSRHGYVICNKHDTVIGRMIEKYGEYMESEVTVFQNLVGGG